MTIFSNSPKGQTMNSLRIVAAAALLICSQVYADTITPNTLTAKPGNTARQIYFNLPLAGDTSKCILNLDYGETDKPGNVYGNTNGPTHINGLSNLERVRTYTTDGTYTFTVTVVSGCTGGPEKVTFTIGTPGTPGTPTQHSGAAAPSSTTANKPTPKGPDGSPADGNKVVPLNIRSIEVQSKKVKVGQEFFVKQWGAGNLKNPSCTSSIVLKRTVGVGTSAGWSQKSADYSVWPKTQVFIASVPGTYEVQLAVSGADAAACGYKGPGIIPGDLTHIEVLDGLKK